MLIVNLINFVFIRTIVRSTIINLILAIPSLYVTIYVSITLSCLSSLFGQFILFLNVFPHFPHLHSPFRLYSKGQTHCLKKTNAFTHSNTHSYFACIHHPSFYLLHWFSSSGYLPKVLQFLPLTSSRILYEPLYLSF